MGSGEARQVLSGLSVILAGGSGGIGAAVAERVASLGGVPVIGCLDNAVRAEALAGDIEARHSITTPVVRGDVLDAAVRKDLIDTAASVGALYGLVPLIGLRKLESRTELSPRDQRKVTKLRADAVDR